MPDPQPPAPEITKGFIRAFGAIEILGGALAYYVGANWYVAGLVPMRWFAVFFMAFGAFMEINPQHFLKRAEPFRQPNTPPPAKSSRV